MSGNTAEYEKAKQVHGDPDLGDRVRVTFDTTVIAAGYGSGGFDPGDVLIGTLPSGLAWWVDQSVEKSQREIVSVEVIKKAEPEWRTDDVIACKHGHTYIRSHEGKWMNSDGIRGDGPCIANTARLLVRQGEVVSA